MEPSQPADLAALVVRWHNRHPLAQRITAAQVAGEGVVLLPYLPRRWFRGRLKRAFDEALIDALHPDHVARFGRHAGSVAHPGPADWPERRATLRAGADPAAVTWRHLYTAAIEVGSTRRRVLVGTGPQGPVLGARLWSPQRRRWAGGGLGGLALAAAAWVSIGLGAWAPGAGHEAAGGASAAATSASGVVRDAASLASPASSTRAMAPSPAASSSRSLAAAPAPAASVAAARPAASSAVAVAPAGAPASAALPAPTVATASASAPLASTTAAAAPAGSAPGASPPPPTSATAAAPPRGILPPLSPEQRRQARTESEAVRAAQAASAAAADPVQALAGAAAGQVFAVATPANRTRAGAQLRIVLMNAPTTADAGQPRAEVLQVSDGWRAVIWPYTDRASAERTRELLAARGIPAEVIAF